MSENYLSVCGQQIKHQDAAKNRGVAALCWGATASPACLIVGTPLLQESYQYLSQARQCSKELAGQNYSAAVEPGLVGAGLYMTVLLPIAFLLRSRKKHLAAAGKMSEKRESLEKKAQEEHAKYIHRIKEGFLI